jgi:hypothetical protein
MMRVLARWTGWGLLLLFLTCMFLFCLFSVALVLVAAVLGLIQVAMGYRPDNLNPLVVLLALVTTVGGLSTTGLYSYLAIRSILGAFWRLLTARPAR